MSRAAGSTCSTSRVGAARRNDQRYKTPDCRDWGLGRAQVPRRRALIGLITAVAGILALPAASYSTSVRATQKPRAQCAKAPKAKPVKRRAKCKRARKRALRPNLIQKLGRSAPGSAPSAPAAKPHILEPPAPRPGPTCVPPWHARAWTAPPPQPPPFEGLLTNRSNGETVEVRVGETLTVRFSQQELAGKPAEQAAGISQTSSEPELRGTIPWSSPQSSDTYVLDSEPFCQLPEVWAEPPPAVVQAGFRAEHPGIAEIRAPLSASLQPPDRPSSQAFRATVIVRPA